MTQLIHKPDCISIVQINVSIPFTIPERVVVNVLAAYYNIIIIIVRTIKENPELVKSNYVDFDLADCYLGRQPFYN